MVSKQSGIMNAYITLHTKFVLTRSNWMGMTYTHFVTPGKSTHFGFWYQLYVDIH